MVFLQNQAIAKLAKLSHLQKPEEVNLLQHYQFLAFLAKYLEKCILSQTHKLLQNHNKTFNMYTSLVSLAINLLRNSNPADLRQAEKCFHQLRVKVLHYIARKSKNC